MQLDSPDIYAAGWRELERRQKALLFSPIIGGLLGATSVLLLHSFDVLSSGLRIAVCVLIGALVGVGLGLRFYFFPCPRCKHNFFKFRHPDNGKCCAHCGLRNGSRINWW